MYLNQCMLIGRISSEIESRRTGKGDHVVTFSIAIPRMRKNDTPDFIEITLWKNNADFAYRFLNKGDKIIVSGQLQQQRWEDKEGRKRNKHIINYAVIHDHIKAKMEEYGEGSTTFTEIYKNDEELPF